MSSAVTGAVSDLWSNSCVKCGAILAIYASVPCWLLSMAYTAIQATVGGN